MRTLTSTKFNVSVLRSGSSTLLYRLVCAAAATRRPVVRKTTATARRFSQFGSVWLVDWRVSLSTLHFIHSHCG